MKKMTIEWYVPELGDIPKDVRWIKFENPNDIDLVQTFEVRPVLIEGIDPQDFYTYDCWFLIKGKKKGYYWNRSNGTMSDLMDYS